MNLADVQVVAYLGAFVVAGVHYQGYLFHESAKDRYWVEHTITEENGQWKSSIHPLRADSDLAANALALEGVMEYLRDQNLDATVVTVIHHPTLGSIPTHRLTYDHASAAVH